MHESASNLTLQLGEKQTAGRLGRDGQTSNDGQTNNT